MASSPSDPFRNTQGRLDALAGVRIYAQLKPDAAGLAELAGLQSRLRELVPRARAVSSGRLHLTLIHFGKADEAYIRLNAATGVSQETFARALGGYLAATEAALPVEDFVLSPVGLAGFGQAGTTLVVEYRSTPGLDETHAVLYRLLLKFLRACGVQDPEAYAARDPALAFSAVLRPHVSILHGFRRRDEAAAPLPAVELPAVELVPLRLHPLPVLYRT